MRIDIETFESGWHSLTWGMSTSEAKHLIANLRILIDHPAGHFHLSSDWEGAPGVGDIEVFIDDSHGAGPMKITSLAIDPDD